MEEYEIEKKIKDGWIKAWFAIEVMASSKELTENALKNHIEKMSKAKDLLILEKKFLDIEKVEFEDKIKEAYSQVAEVTLLVKDLLSLIVAIVLYGPSAIEILEPKEKKIKIDEIQNIANFIAGLMHQFAQAGLGGIVIKT
jgi:hypothetical protein